MSKSFLYHNERVTKERNIMSKFVDLSKFYFLCFSANDLEFSFDGFILLWIFLSNLEIHFIRKVILRQLKTVFKLDMKHKLEKSCVESERS